MKQVKSRSRRFKFGIWYLKQNNDIIDLLCPSWSGSWDKNYRSTFPFFLIIDISISVLAVDTFWLLKAWLNGLRRNWNPGFLCSIPGWICVLLLQAEQLRIFYGRISVGNSSRNLLEDMPLKDWDIEGERRKRSPALGGIRTHDLLKNESTGPS